MIFNPEESIDIHGFTGSFMQYTYARIKSILRKSESEIPAMAGTSPLLPLEKQLVIVLEQFPGVLQEAAAEYDPSKVALYVFNLAQSFNSLYSQHKINGAESPEKETLRLQLAQLTAQVIKTGMGLLGIRVPERM
jgi:arginyl-tRNA synthetase